jgi:hypothetical protein
MPPAIGVAGTTTWNSVTPERIRRLIASARAWLGSVWLATMRAVFIGSPPWLRFSVESYRRRPSGRHGAADRIV